MASEFAEEVSEPSDKGFRSIRRQRVVDDRLQVTQNGSQIFGLIRIRTALVGVPLGNHAGITRFDGLTVEGQLRRECDWWWPLRGATGEPSR